MSTIIDKDLQHVAVTKAALIAGVSEKTMRGWISSGKLPHVRYGTTIRVTLEALLRGF